MFVRLINLNIDNYIKILTLTFFITVKLINIILSAGNW